MEGQVDIGQTVEQLNGVYAPLERKAHQLLQGLRDRIPETEFGWYSGHYRRGRDGEYHRDFFPIPVIGVRGYCDIEIHLDCVAVTAKLKRGRALESSYEELKGFSFEAYGVENYLQDFYVAGSTVSQMKEAIRQSGESEIGFSFRMDFGIDGDGICEFLELLRREGFYY